MTPPDLELSELTVSGLEEPNAAWTEAAKRHVENAIVAELARHQAQGIPYQAPQHDLEKEQAHRQLRKLHEASA